MISKTPKVKDEDINNQINNQKIQTHFVVYRVQL